MHRFLIHTICFSTLAANIVAAQPETPPADDQVIIRGETYHIYPPELLAAKGVRVFDIPREENAAFRYFDAINLLQRPDEEIDELLNHACSGKWPEDEAAAKKLADYLDTNAASIELAHEASALPDYWLPLFGNEGDPLFALLLPSLGDTRMLAKLAAADALRQSINGNYAAAMDNVLMAQRMGNQIGHGSTMIEGLVGIAIGRLASDQLTRLAENPDIPSEILIETTAELEALSADMPTFDDMLRAEQALNGQFIDDYINRPEALTGFMPVPPGLNVSIGPPESGWAKLIVELKKVYLPDRAVKRHMKSYYEKVREGTRPKSDGTPGTILEEDKLLEVIPRWDFISMETIPSFSRAYEMTLWNKSNFERARIRTAIEAYKRDTGAMPPNLTALTPSYISNIPADPMTGFDFEYAPKVGESGAPVGLETVNQENAEALKRKRKTPAILTPRASKWRRFVMSYADQYDFSPRQRASAEAILRDVEARAAAFERSQGARIKALIDEGDTDTAKKKMGPLDKLFDELQKRLDRLPTREQRAANSETRQ